MPSVYRVLVMAGALALSLIYSCSSGPNLQTQVPDPDNTGVVTGEGFPAFGDLPERSVTGLSAQVNGSDYNRDMPSSNVAPQGVMGEFSPDWDPAVPGSNNLAYAIYSLHIDPAEAAPTFEMTFARDQLRDDVTVGLGNTISGAWDWLEDESKTTLKKFVGTYDTKKHISSENNLTLIVVFMGIEPWLLQEIAIDRGEPITSARVMSVAMSGPAGSTVDLMLAEVQGTAPYTIHWYFGGAATPASSEELEPTVVLNDTPGEYACYLILDNDYGDPYLHEFPLTVTGDVDGWTSVVAPAAEFVQLMGTNQVATQVDTDGNCYVASTATGQDLCTIAVQKLNSQGEPEFLSIWNDEGDSQLRDMAVTADGLYLLGWTGDQMTTYGDSFLVKADEQGSVDWSVSWFWNTLYRCKLYCLTEAADGSIYLAGYGGSEGGLLAKLRPDGATDWARGLGMADSYTYFTEVTVSPSGDVFVAGLHYGSENGVIVARYSSNGDLAWSSMIPVDGWSMHELHGLDADADGNTYITVEYTSNLSRVIKLDAAGNYSAGVQFSDGWYSICDLVVNPSGKVYLAGGTMAAGYPTASMDLLIATIDGDLSPASLDVRSWGTADSFQMARAMTLDQQGRPYIAGDVGYAVYGLYRELDASVHHIYGISTSEFAGDNSDMYATTTPKHGELIAEEFQFNEYDPNGVFGSVTLRYDGF